MHYKFIDIGCGHSNVSVDIYGLDVRGLLVEPIKEFCDVLPNSTKVIIENCAITNYDGELEINITNQDMRDLIYFPINVLKTKKHAERLHKKYKIYGSESIIHKDGKPNKRKVPCFTLETLLKKYNIDELDVLKIDVEGHEAIILKQVIHLLETKRLKINEYIIFEYNDLSNKTELDNIVNIINEQFGYTHEFKTLGWNEDIIMTKIK